MDIKLTAAQEKLIEALKANPGTDAQEHLNHIHNQAIADEMIDKLLKFSILQLNPETGLRELAPTIWSQQRELTMKRQQKKFRM